jgi:cytochrome c oxidase subunit 2
VSGSRPLLRRFSRARLLTRSGLLTVVLLTVSGCSTDKIPAFGMPDPITDQGHRVLALWKGSWLAAWLVGILVWGLMAWVIVRYRKRSDDLPPQVHYNIPIEILYTVLPFVMIAVLFYFTARDENEIDKLSTHPDLTVDVIGYQWAWQFDYADGPAAGLQIHGRPGEYPQLVLPVGQKIRFRLTSPDVVHAFWVPSFLFKRDVIPGRVNQFEVTIEKTGTFRGECTELCGVDHDRMLFTLRSVSQGEFASFAANALAEAKSGASNDQFTYITPTGKPPTAPGATGTEPNQEQQPGSDS